MLAQCSRPSPPNVILIVLDTLRADRVGAYGNTRGLTPFLDSLAKESLVYERAYAPSSWTVPSVASLFVGQYPSEHQVMGADSLLADGERTLAEMLKQHGFVTGGLSANLEVSVEGGFAQGFDAFRVIFQPPKDDAARVNHAAFEWLDSIAGARPVFLFLQYMEPHSPYRFHPGVTVPPDSGLEIDDAALGDLVNVGAFGLVEGYPIPSAWKFEAAELRRLIQLYDGEVAYLDRALAQLFDGLKRRGMLDHALVIITADHGEEFGEHGMFAHGNTLFEATMRIPLLIRLPGNPRPRRIEEPATLAGLAPTVLRQLDIPIPASFRVAPLPLDTVGGAGLVYGELIKDRHSYFRLHERALVSRTGKLLIGNAGEELFYDLTADPGETQPLSAPPFAGDLRLAMHRIVSQLSTRAERRSAPLDAVTRERLRALGYAN